MLVLYVTLFCSRINRLGKHSRDYQASWATYHHLPESTSPNSDTTAGRVQFADRLRVLIGGKGL